MTDLEEILKWANKSAKDIIGKTDAVRDDVWSGRPNSSEESTTRGVLEALGVILPAIPRDS